MRIICPLFVRTVPWRSFSFSAVAFGPVVLCCSACPWGPCSEEDSVFNWETAEAFPVLQTVFPRCAFLIGGNEAAEKRATRVTTAAQGCFSYTLHILSSHLSLDDLWRMKAASPVVESFHHLLISLVFHSQRDNVADRMWNCVKMIDRVNILFIWNFDVKLSMRKWSCHN